MLCSVKFNTVDPSENFGKYAMHVTESATNRVWRELRFNDERMLFSVLTNVGLAKTKQANLLQTLSKPSGEVSTMLSIPDDYAIMLRY